MQHIVSGNEIDLHQIEDNDGAKCKCNPKVEINPHTQDLFVIHISFNSEFNISNEDIKGIFEFVTNDPNYEGGNIYVDECEDEEVE